ncbi:MAG: hypothetical protein BJ554DRAFT_4060 [Olpidium bornovanus]|uniref:Uncharacterized protein n=1 Tax=Olpidium bornovanus TaxID=278681 RepID=A0A8H8DFC9_9FUNG|nr:MAG: hypothetical protein BJ554DRAFT_4060 [Olpidium bornovanus]
MKRNVAAVETRDGGVAGNVLHHHRRLRPASRTALHRFLQLPVKLRGRKAGERQVFVQPFVVLERPRLDAGQGFLEPPLHLLEIPVRARELGVDPLGRYVYPAADVKVEEEREQALPQVFELVGGERRELVERPGRDGAGHGRQREPFHVVPEPVAAKLDRPLGVPRAVEGGGPGRAQTAAAAAARGEERARDGRAEHAGRRPFGVPRAPRRAKGAQLAQERAADEVLGEAGRGQDPVRRPRWQHCAGAVAERPGAAGGGCGRAPPGGDQGGASAGLGLRCAGEEAPGVPRKGAVEGSDRRGTRDGVGQPEGRRHRRRVLTTHAGARVSVLRPAVRK